MLSRGDANSAAELLWQSRWRCALDDYPEVV